MQVTPYLLVLMSVLYSCCAHAEPAAQDPRFLFLEGVLTGPTLAPLQEALDRAIAHPDDDRPISILINSPGGSVIVSTVFINRMQTLRDMGVDINCYVLDVAASMAFQVLTQCTNRYALPTSFLLWHGVRVSTMAPITAASAKRIAEDLERMDNLIQLQLGNALHMNAADVQYHFDNETLWSGYELNANDPHFLTLRSSYPELLTRLNTAVRMGQELFLFGLGGNRNTTDGEMVYVWSEYEQYLGNRATP